MKKLKRNTIKFIIQFDNSIVLITLIIIFYNFITLIIILLIFIHYNLDITSEFIQNI